MEKPSTIPKVLSAKKKKGKKRKSLTQVTTGPAKASKPSVAALDDDIEDGDGNSTMALSLGRQILDEDAEDSTEQDCPSQKTYAL